MKSLEYIGQMYVGPNNGGAVDVTESFLEDVLN